MASISKRGSRWLVQIRRKGVPPQSQMFDAHSDAKAWAALEEARIERAEPVVPRRLLAATTLHDIMARYLIEVTPRKRSAATEKQRLNHMMRDPLCRVTLANLDSASIAEYRDRRLVSTKPATVRRELAIVSHAIEIARKEWGFRLPSNPVKDVRQPAVTNARDRRLQPGELEQLLGAIASSRNHLLRPIVLIAIETGMRRGEILNLTWDCVNLVQATAHIPLTKTGNPRTIPLTPSAISLLEQMPSRSGRVFDLSPNALKLAWVRAVARSELPDLHFHDLRHEAISRFFEIGLSLPEVALISGHRDPRMLFRYVHLRPFQLAQKLAANPWVDANVPQDMAT